MKHKRITKHFNRYTALTGVLIGLGIIGFGTWHLTHNAPSKPLAVSSKPRVQWYPVFNHSGPPKRYTIANTPLHLLVPAGWQYDDVDEVNTPNTSNVSFFSPGSYIWVEISDGYSYTDGNNPAPADTAYIKKPPIGFDSITVLGQSRLLRYMLMTDDSDGEHVTSMVVADNNSHECIASPDRPNLGDYHYQTSLCLRITNRKKGTNVSDLTGQRYFAEAKQMLESLSE